VCGGVERMAFLMPERERVEVELGTKEGHSIGMRRDGEEDRKDVNGTGAGA
jgi:hypothetical protein